MAFNKRFLESALEEVDAIVAGLTLRSPKAAKNFLDSLDDQLERLSSGALTYGLCRVGKLARLGYRSALFDKYLFLYYLDGDDLVVAHVFHQRQDYARLVAPRPIDGK